MLAVIGFSSDGIAMLFEPFADPSSFGFIFAVHVLRVLISFSALMSVLYHLGIMQWIVKIVGGALHWVIGSGRVESLNAAANIFIGQTEAPLVIRPYLRGLTEPQFFALMVSGVASIAGTVLAGYVMMGAETKYLLAAAFMAAPGGLLMAKMLMPDEELEPDHGAKLEMERSHYGNVILAAATGATDGRRLVPLPGADDAVDSRLGLLDSNVAAQRALGRSARGGGPVWRKTGAQ